MSNQHPSADQFFATAIPIASKWLQECSANHTSCGKTARHSTVFCTDNSLLISDLEGEGLVATRLLSFPLKPSNESEDFVRLALSESLSADTQYAALSHRWGTDETICTTRANLDDMVGVGILTSELPATFRDAVHIARGLGLSHIWIDSFCIVQDDKDDWKTEARRMAIIYDKAACTIAAADGLNSDAGLYVRDPKLKLAGVLDTRAWVCQERMISPRSLIFSEDSVVWECRECDASLKNPELAVRAARDATETPTHPKDIFAFFRDFRPQPPRPEEESGSEEWEDEEEDEHDDAEVEGLNEDERDSDEEEEQQTDEGVDEETDDENTVDMSDDECDNTEMTEPGASENVIRLEPGSLDDEAYDSDGYPAWSGHGLPGHAANLSVFLEGQRKSKAYTMHPDGPNEDGSEPFGDFMVVVTNLNRPREAYFPFLKTWWEFLSSYSTLSLTYDSDKFLAINGITTVAQRWSHLRSSFGLFWHFVETEMLWYVDPKGPSGTRHDSWLVPTWSWASTRNGRVVNDTYRRVEMDPDLLVKPEFKMGMGTAFDQPLPFVAWMARRYHSIEMKGDLRKGIVTATREPDGSIKYIVALDELCRLSDEEVHDFRPDCAEEFPVGKAVSVLYMVWYHYDAVRCKLDEHIDVGLVFKQLKGEAEIMMHEVDVLKESLSQQRLLTRLGYMETTYPAASMRSREVFMGELTWYFVRLA